MDIITTAATIYTPPATSIVHQTSASMTDRAPSTPVHLTQYDTTMPVIEVALIANGQPYSVPAGAAVNVRLAKPDGTYVYNPAFGVSADGKTVYIAITVQMTVFSGKVSPIVEVVLNGAVAGTGFFVLDIDPNPIPEDAIESTDEYKTIQQLAAQVQQAAQIVSDNEEAINTVANNLPELNTVADIAGNVTTVAGISGNVTTVAENAPQMQKVVDNLTDIQNAEENAAAADSSATLAKSWAVGGTGTRDGEDTNNAKYWSEQAQAIAQGQLGWYATPQALQSAHPTGQNGQWAIIGTTDTIWTWDGDTSAWVNTDSQIDMSNYYQKQEANARFQMPVGFIFEWAPVDGQSVDLSTPQKVASYFGYGTWAAFAAGKVMAGVNAAHGVGTSVGAETHAITVREMPVHAHVYNGWAVAIPSGAGSEMYALVKPYDQHNNFGMNTKSAGDGAAMSLMQPTIYVYIWQRIG